MYWSYIFLGWEFFQSFLRLIADLHFNTVTHPMMQQFSSNQPYHGCLRASALQMSLNGILFLSVNANRLGSHVIGSRLFWDVSKQIKVDEGESDGKKNALVFGACLTSIENLCLVWEFGKNCLWKKNKGVSTIDESKPIREYKTEYTIPR